MVLFFVILISSLSFVSANNNSDLDITGEKTSYIYDHSLLDPIVFNYKNNLSAQGGADFLIANNTIKVQGSSILDTRERVESDIKDIRDKIITYVVQPGDTISEIAKDFHISQNTVIWENNIKKGMIKPGQKLTILPTSGLKYKIKKGDTLDKIAKKFKADKEDIADYNNLDKSLKIGELIIIPGGKKILPKSKRVSKSKYVKTKRIRYSKRDYGWLTHPAPGSVRTQGIHGKNAIDMGAPIGTPILAAASGKVIKAYYGGYCARKSGCGIWGGGYGNYIKIQHHNGVITLYAHLSKVSVFKGQEVIKGQQIGLMGSTGRSTGSHLHFEVRGAKNPF